MSAPGSWIEVDRSAIAANIRAVRARVGPDVLVMALVKADGYGHGAAETARTVLAAGADRVGVARVREGIQLREAGIQGGIHVLEPFHELDLDSYVSHDLVATVCDVEAASAMSRHGAGSRKLAAHVKVDTGMARLGLHHQGDREAICRILSLPGVVWEGIFTHLARADEPGDSADLQLDRFDRLLDSLGELRPPVAHAANSAGIFRHPRSHLQMVRPGLAVYGYGPTPEDGLELVPALSLRSTVRHLSWKETGDSVSYGGTWTAKRRTCLAVLPLGYGDGFWRAHSGRIEVQVEGVLCPQVGRICMDQMMVDVTDLAQVAVGSPAVVIGRDPALSATRLARNMDTIVYEVLCDLGRRLERRYVG